MWNLINKTNWLEYKKFSRKFLKSTNQIDSKCFFTACAEVSYRVELSQAPFPNEIGLKSEVSFWIIKVSNNNGLIYVVKENYLSQFYISSQTLKHIQQYNKRLDSVEIMR